MIIGIPRETRHGETRVAATPETVKKLAASGKHSLYRRGGRRSIVEHSGRRFPGGRRAYGQRRPGARRGHRAQGPRSDRGRAAQAQARRAAHRPARSLRRGRHPVLRRCRRQRLRAGKAAAHFAGAIDGRAVVAGQHRRLQGGDDRGQHLRQVHADADDRGGHGQGRARADSRRRRRRIAGHRHRQAARCGDRGVRRPSVGEGPGRVARREMGRRALRQRRGTQDRRGCGRLCAPDAAGMDGAAVGHHRRALQGGRHPHHHRADSRAPGAETDQGGHGGRR